MLTIISFVKLTSSVEVHNVIEVINMDSVPYALVALVMTAILAFPILYRILQVCGREYFEILWS